MNINQAFNLSTVDPAALIRSARIASGLPLRALAEQAGTSHSAIAAYESGRKNPSLDVLLRLLGACDVSFEVTPIRRIRSKDNIRRGEELEQVLSLAEQFPATHDKNSGFPRFGREPVQ